LAFGGTCLVVAKNGISFEEFAWLLCILSIVQIFMFGFARIFPERNKQ
jgi:hypothetical protein